MYRRLIADGAAHRGLGQDGVMVLLDVRLAGCGRHARRRRETAAAAAGPGLVRPGRGRRSRPWRVGRRSSRPGRVAGVRRVDGRGRGQLTRALTWHAVSLSRPVCTLDARAARRRCVTARTAALAGQHPAVLGGGTAAARPPPRARPVAPPPQRHLTGPYPPTRSPAGLAQSIVHGPVAQHSVGRGDEDALEDRMAPREGARRDLGLRTVQQGGPSRYRRADRPAAQGRGATSTCGLRRSRLVFHALS